MPVEYQDSTTFPKTVALLVAREASKPGDFGGKESPSGRYRNLLKSSPKHPPGTPFHVPAGTEGIAPWIPTHRRHRSTLRKTTQDRSEPQTCSASPSAVKCLNLWRKESSHPGENDFLFSSTRLKGKKPLSPNTLLKKIIRPALKSAGIEGKAIGWHTPVTPWQPTFVLLALISRRCRTSASCELADSTFTRGPSP